MSQERNKPPKYASVALCAPAVRMVVVHACAWDVGDGKGLQAFHELIPVLAIRSVVNNEEDVIQDSIMVYTEEFGVWDMENALVCSNASNVVAVCPWGPEEDESRLEGQIQRARREALEAETDSIRRRVAASSRTGVTTP